MTSSPTVRFLDRATPPHISTLILIAGISALNMSVFLPSLQNMADYFGTDYAVMQLSVSAYLAMTAILQILVGPISDRFGRRKVVLVSLGLFCVATLGTILAPTVGMFLFFRMAQAVVATCMVLSRAIVRDMVPQEEAASMIGYVTMGMALVPMVGPIIGGALDEAFGWHATFVFLLLSGLLIFALCWRDLGETVQGSGMSFSEQVATYPELLGSPRFWGYVLVAGFASGAFFAFLGGASFVADQVFGLRPLWAGVSFGAPAIGYAIGNGISGRYSVRFGIDKLILIGCFITAAGLGVSLAISALGASSALVFFGFCTFVGLGNGLVMPNATAGMLSVRPHLAGTASGLGGAVLIGFGALLSAVVGLLLTPGRTELILVAMMFISAFAALATMLWLNHLIARRARAAAL